MEQILNIISTALTIILTTMSIITLKNDKNYNQYIDNSIFIQGDNNVVKKIYTYKENDVNKPTKKSNTRRIITKTENDSNDLIYSFLFFYIGYSIFIQNKILTFCMVLIFFILDLIFLIFNREKYNQPIYKIICLVGLFFYSYFLLIDIYIIGSQDLFVNIYISILLLWWTILSLIGNLKAILKYICCKYSKKYKCLLRFNVNYSSTYNFSLVFATFGTFINVCFYSFVV